jgi:signal peptide peptidase SppA
MKIRTEQRQFRPTSQSGQHVVAMQPEAFGFMFFGGWEENRVTEDGIAIVSICGPLEHHPGWFDSYDAITQRIDDALDADEVRAVVLCFDSPGGDASGVEEAHRKIKSMRETHDKPIFAYSNESCYSAAYWLACAADELFLPPTGGAGSVGVIAAAIDCTKANEKAGVRVELVTTGARKADGHPDRPLTSDVLDVLQARVDQIGEVFFASVAEARDTSAGKVRALQAGCFLGQAAVEANLADGVAGWDEFLALVRSTVLGVDAPATDPVRLGGHAPVSGNPASRSPGTMKAKLLALTQAVAKAEAAVEAAKTPEERKAALAALKAASDAEAKVKYSKRTRTDELEEDDGDEDSEEESEEDEDEEEDDKPPPSKKDDDSDDDDDDAEEEESEEDDSKKAEEEEAKALKALSGKGGSDKAASLYRAVVALTGKRNLSEQLGALSAFESRIKSTSKLETRLAKLEGERARDKVDAMLNKASTDGRVTPAARESLRAQGLKDPKWLKGHLAALPKVRTPERAALPNTAATEQAPKFAVESMSAEDRTVIESAAASAGLSFDDFVKKMNARGSTVGTPTPTH